MAKRLYVGNLAYSVTEADLREVFTETGTVADVKVVLDRESGRPRGFAFVEMSTDDEAAKAMQTLNGREIQGRAISVSEARERSGGGGGGGGGGGAAMAAVALAVAVAAAAASARAAAGRPAGSPSLSPHPPCRGGNALARQGWDLSPRHRHRRIRSSSFFTLCVVL